MMAESLDQVSDLFASDWDLTWRSSRSVAIVGVSTACQPATTRLECPPGGPEVAIVFNLLVDNERPWAYRIQPKG